MSMPPLMHHLFTWPCHQQRWCWLCRINVFLSSMRKCLNDRKWKYVYIFRTINPERQEFKYILDIRSLASVFHRGNIRAHLHIVTPQPYLLAHECCVSLLYPTIPSSWMLCLFCELKSFHALLVVLLYAISCYFGPCHNGIRLYHFCL